MFSTYYIISYIFFYESKFTLCIIQFHLNYIMASKKPYDNRYQFKRYNNQ